MKLLLCKNVEHLGIVGDVVDVKPGYARNYLVPMHLATTPTQGNMKQLAEARRIAESDLAESQKQLAALAAQVNELEVTIRAKANEDGVLYGSVGRKEIAAAIAEEGYDLIVDHIQLRDPIRHLDNITVDIRFTPELTSQVKVWVVREKEEGEGEDGEGDEASADAGEGAGTEAAADDTGGHE
jgi:large subunit ribosomal protein L9